MRRDMIWFILMLVINLIICIVYLVVALFFKKANRRLSIIRTVVMLCAPGVGPLFFGIGWLFYRFIFYKDVDLSDVVFSKEREREIIRTNEEQGRNMVSLEEAIEITNKSDLRNLLMNVAQGDYSDSLSSISRALDCEDTETAHYAASVLQETLNDFRFRVAQDCQKVNPEAEDLQDTVTEMISYMDKVLSQKVFSNVEQKKYVGILSDVANVLFNVKPEAITSEMNEIIALRLLDIKDYENCEIWALRAKAMYPNTLSSYTSLLKLYYNSEQKEKFFIILDEVKASSIVIDSKTLELIRTFS